MRSILLALSITFLTYIQGWGQIDINTDVPNATLDIVNGNEAAPQESLLQEYHRKICIPWHINIPRNKTVPLYI
ncbi:hypothetical protein ETU10_06300 [Apibacter muscae]|nr:hypothetical protein ETU10_06300 [Apibacter muscae]